MPTDSVAVPVHRTIPVLRMRPGDHAYADYDDDEARWEVLLTFIHEGLARGEKVTVMADPAVPAEDVHERVHVHHGSAGAAFGRGQLSYTTMRDLISPDARFTAARQMGRLREETETARRQGFTGFRTVIDMAWVEDLGMDIEGVMHRETHAHDLFADRRYAEICTYDRRRFDPDVLDAMRHGHPVALLSRLGALRIEHADGGLRLIGDADVATRPQLLAELPAALDLAAATGSGHVPVDLTGLSFLGSDCAMSLLHAARQLPAGGPRMEIRCLPFHARVLGMLGARSVEQVTVTKVADA
ncbi:MEDS domain-containing protein [Kitasatospora sp. NBC_00374]|uniref:MEDS domain-containing protein n=1 Tax=Kitasatospora sp. NBC_00374 TaxID=2975964 RepID=UPI0032520C35